MRVRLIALAALLGLAACGHARKVPPPAPIPVERPLVGLAGVKVDALGFSGVDLAFDCEIENPNPFPLSVAGVRYALAIEDLVDEPMLNVDPSGVRTAQIAHQLLERRRSLIRVLFEYAEEGLGLGLQAGSSQMLGVLLGGLRVDEPPGHQSSSLSSSSAGVAMPSRMDSRMPGIETR